MPSSPKKKARRKQDFYPTPEEVIKGLIETLPPGVMYDIIIDPGAGPDGRIGRTLLDAGLARRIALIDIQEPDPDIPADPRVDITIGDAVEFLRTQAPSAGTKLVAMNPPFSLAMEFLAESVALTNRCPDPCAVVQLTPLSFLGAECRADWLGSNPPHRVAVINPRPSFTGDGGSDSSVYAWISWYNPASLKAGWPTEWTWLYCPNPQRTRKRKARA